MDILIAKNASTATSTEAISRSLEPQYAALAAKMGKMIEENEHEIKMKQDEEEERQKSLAEEMKTKKRIEIWKCAACGGRYCTFMPRLEGYADADD